MHRERTRVAHRLTASADELPFGTIVSVGGRACVVVDGGMRAWTHGGYAHHEPWPDRPVTVLTPPSTLAAMLAGWQPGVHPSARA